VTRRLVRDLGVSLFVLAAVSTAFAVCDPATQPDASDIAAARAAVAANCDCAAAATHGAYVSCAAHQATLTLVDKSCARFVERCASKSTCGKPGFVTCCRTSKSGTTSCSLKSSAEKCRAPKGGGACTGVFASCRDACASGGCATPTTTTLPACSGSTFPTCGGTCPAGMACQGNSIDNACECFPDGAQACADSLYPICNGTCPAGEQCGLLSLLGGCGCVLAGTTPCGETGGMCGTGACPTGQSCGLISTPSLTYCTCAPTGSPVAPEESPAGRDRRAASHRGSACARRDRVVADGAGAAVACYWPCP